MTGRVCPAPCKAVQKVQWLWVTIHDNERFIIDTAFEKVGLKKQENQLLVPALK